MAVGPEAARSLGGCCGRRLDALVAGKFGVVADIAVVAVAAGSAARIAATGLRMGCYFGRIDALLGCLEVADSSPGCSTYLRDCYDCARARRQLC